MVDNYIVIDFETRSSFPLKKGATPYVALCEPMCMAVKPKDKRATVVYFQDIKPLAEKILTFSKKNYVVAHNASFDFKVFQKVTGCPDSAIENWIDTQTLSLFSGGSDSLEKCGKFWGLENSKINDGGLLDVLATPKHKRTPKLCHGLEIKNLKVVNGFIEDEYLFHKLGEYCKGDTLATDELFLRLLPNYSEFVKKDIDKNFILNYLRNKKGIHFDLKKVEILKNTYEELWDKYQQIGRIITKNWVSPKGKTFNINSHKHFTQYLSEKGYHIKTTQEKDLFQIKPKEEDIKDLIKLRISRPNVMGRRYETILNHNIDGVIYDSIFFYDAITGRYISRGTVQALNFPRSLKIDKDVFKLIKEKKFFKTYTFDSYKHVIGLMRSCIIPHKGCEFLGGDFSAIELKLLLAAVGEYQKLKKVQAGWDVYKYFASKVFKKPENKITVEERYIAKRATLSFGYGTGVEKLIETLLEDKIVLSVKDAQDLKNAYFKTFPKIKLFWKKMFKPFLKARRIPHVEIEVPFCKKKLHFWNIENVKETDRWGREGWNTYYKNPSYVAQKKNI